MSCRSECLKRVIKSNDKLGSKMFLVPKLVFSSDFRDHSKMTPRKEGVRGGVRMKSRIIVEDV